MCRVVSKIRSRELSKMGGCDNCCVRQNLEQLMTIDSFLLAQGNCFSDRLHANSQQGIRDDFHRRPRAASAQIKILACNRIEKRLSSLKEFFVATTEERQSTFLIKRGAAVNRRVHILHPSLMTELI